MQGENISLTQIQISRAFLSILGTNGHIYIGLAHTHEFLKNSDLILKIVDH